MRISLSVISVVLSILHYQVTETLSFVFQPIPPSQTFPQHGLIFGNSRVDTFTIAKLSSSEESQEQQESITVEKLTEMIDTTFVNACMQLAKGYVDVLKLFIVSAKSGYELGIDPLELIQNVDAIENKAAGRELMPEEIELRNTWIQVVYFVLQQTKHNSANDEGMSIDTKIAFSFQSKFETLQKRKRDGEESFRVDDSLIDSSVELDPLKTAIMTQSLRVIWYTLIVLEEEERCNTEFARQDAPMTPPIPGAFERKLE